MDGGGGEGGGRAGAFSLFTARVSSLRGGVGGGGGVACRGARGAGRGGIGGDESKAYFFVVTDDGIHDVPTAAALGEGDDALDAQQGQGSRSSPC